MPWHLLSGYIRGRSGLVDDSHKTRKHRSLLVPRPCGTHP